MENNVLSREPTVAQKGSLPRREDADCRYAARLIRREDFVYLDAGTTTGYILDFLEETGYVRDKCGIPCPEEACRQGIHVASGGGTLKAIYRSGRRNDGSSDAA